MPDSFSQDAYRSKACFLKAIEAARTMLADVYNWFTEKFDIVDLQKAQALLEELSHRVIEALRD